MQDNQEERAIFATTMYGIAEDFGGTLSNDNLHVRFAALQDYSIDQITKAGTWLIRHREKTFPAMPTTKEFIDAINAHQNGLISPKTKAGIEADKVLETLKEWGRDAEPLFIDEITKYLMTRRWTFRQLDTMAVKDPGLIWWRKEFVESYLELAKDQSTCWNMLEDKEAANVVRMDKLQNLAIETVRRLPS